MKTIQLYTLEENNTIIYIGKTTRSLKTRLYEHKRNNFLGRSISISFLDEFKIDPSNGWQEYQYLHQFLSWGLPLENKQRNGKLHAIRSNRHDPEKRKQYLKKYEEDHKELRAKQLKERTMKNWARVLENKKKRYHKKLVESREIQRKAYAEKIASWTEEDQAKRNEKNRKARLAYKLKSNKLL